VVIISIKERQKTQQYLPVELEAACEHLTSHYPPDHLHLERKAFSPTENLSWTPNILRATKVQE
jgi:hypothetical protein